MMCAYHPFCIFQQFYFPQKLADSLRLWVFQTLRYLPGSTCLMLFSSQETRNVVVIVIVIIIIIKIYIYGMELQKLWGKPNLYQSDFFSLENATKRASRWKFPCFLLMNTPLSPWPDNVQCSAFAEWKWPFLHPKSGTPLPNWRF